MLGEGVPGGVSGRNAWDEGVFHLPCLPSTEKHAVAQPAIVQHASHASGPLRQKNDVKTS